MSDIHDQVTSLHRRTLPEVLGEPVATPAERRAEGQSLRKETPRSVHADWEPFDGRRDPVELIETVSATRLPDLVPVRNERMLASPFAFFRGSALAMALDLATTPNAGINVQLCGDAHLMNFGVFASPERTLLFDLNDFDETWPGPFEWDVKRLATSVELAGRANRHSTSDRRRSVMASVASYRHWMERYSEMTHLEVWYSKVDVRAVLDLMSGSDRRRSQRVVNKALSRDHHAAVAKLTEEVDGRRRIIPSPPLVTRVDGDLSISRQLPAMIEAYRDTLTADRQALFDRYRLVDVARKVVGVGSVGTRCWIVLFQGPNGGPLFLQIKEAGLASPEAAGLPGRHVSGGERVVVGQRLLQSASDLLLGWTSAPESGVDYYVRQLWDSKASAEVDGMTPAALATYSGGCGWALARAHARTGDSVRITGYLGSGTRFDEALADFAVRYADQTEQDFALARSAADRGVLPMVSANN